MTKRPDGAGGIRQRKNGSFEISTYDADGKRRWATARTLEEAEKILAAANKVFAKAPPKPTSSPTLRSFGEAWLDRREKSGAHRAIHVERSAWRTHVETAPFYDTALRALQRREIKRWVEQLGTKNASRGHRQGKTTVRVETTRKLSWKTVKHVLGLVRQCLDAAVDEELLVDNPAANIEVARKASIDDEWTFLSLEEIELVSRRVTEPSRSIFVVAIYTGLRAGELWSLRWEDVVLEGPRPEIIVRRSHEGPTKSGRVRRVPLLDPALREFAHLRRAAELTGNELVFPALRGERRGRGDDAGWADRKVPKSEIARWSAVPKNRGKTPRTIIEGWKTKLGIERRVRFHDLRHTCASHLVMGSWGTQWTLQEVAAFLGHADTTVTEIYAHLSPDHLHRRADATFQPPQSVVVESSLVPPGTSQSPGILLARPRGLEPLTSRSVARGTPESSRVVTPSNHHSTTSNPVRAFLEAVARRDEDIEPPFAALMEHALLEGFIDEVVEVMGLAPEFRLRRALGLVRKLLAVGAAKKVSAG